MLSISSDGTYTTYGKTHPITRHAMYCHLVRQQAKAGIVAGPPSYRDIPDRLNEAQKQAWYNKESARPLCVQQEQIIKGFTINYGPMICDNLMRNGRHKQLQTAILDYSLEEWLDAIYRTLSTVIPWWFYYRLHMFNSSSGAQMHNVRLMWLHTCIGPRDSYQEQTHVELISRTDLVEVASEIDSSPPIQPSDRATGRFVNDLTRLLDQRVPNGYLHTLFSPNAVKIILENFGFTSCLDLKRFFEAFRDRENDLIKWIRQDQGVLCPRDRTTVIPRNMMPHDVATTFNGLTATFARHKAYKHDRDLSLPLCFEKYNILNDYYTAEQLEALQEYVRVTSNYVLHHLREEEVEEAVEMMLQDLQYHPHLTFALKAMKSARVFTSSHMTRVAMAHSRYVEVRLEFLRSRTTDGEIVNFPDLACAFVLPNPEGAIEIDSENEQERIPLPPPPPIHIRHDAIGYEPNSSKSHEIAKRNAHRWVVASTFAIRDYLKTFEMIRYTKLCRNCMFSRRHNFQVSRIAHDTAKCNYANLWDAMRDTGLYSADFDLEQSEDFNKKMSLDQMDEIRKQWIQKSERQRRAFEEMAAQMPIDSCNNCLFQYRNPRGGFAIMHKTEACRNLNIYMRLFDDDMKPREGRRDD